MCLGWSCYTHLTPLVLWPLDHLTLKATGVCTGKFHGTGTAGEPVPVIYACPSPSTRKLQTLKSNPTIPEQDLLAYHHSSGLRGGCLIKHTSWWGLQSSIETRDDREDHLHTLPPSTIPQVTSISLLFVCHPEATSLDSLAVVASRM